MRIDSSLREALLSHSAEAPSGVGLLDAVQDRSRRHRRHRWAAIGLVALVTAGGTIAVPIALGAGGSAPVPPATAPAPTLGWVLVAADLVMPPPFPYTPGWTPAGLAPPSTSFAEGEYRLSYQVKDADSLAMWLAVDRKQPDWTNGKVDPQSHRAVDVRGRPGTLWTTDQGYLLIWPEHDRWVTVGGNRPITEADVRRYAEELRDEPVPLPVPFEYALIPAGTEVDLVHESAMSLQLRDDPPSGGVTIGLRPTVPEDSTGALTVRGLPATMDTQGGELRALNVVLGDGRTLTIVTLGSLEMDTATLVRFAEGITIRAVD